LPSADIGVPAAVFCGLLNAGVGSRVNYVILTTLFTQTWKYRIKHANEAINTTEMEFIKKLKQLCL